MNGDVLSRIFEVEREISGRLDEEKRKISAWMDKVGREVEEEFREEEQKLIAALSQAAGRVREEAVLEAARRRSEAAAEGEALKGLSDERMREIVLKYLPGILPDTA
jgi:hypothetical protein